MKQLLIYPDGTKVINLHEGATLEANMTLGKEIDLTELSNEDIDLLKVSLDDDVALNQVLAKIGQNV